MAPQRILCVAEKPSIAKAVAQHLGGGRVTTVRGIAILSQAKTAPDVMAEKCSWPYLCEELRVRFQICTMGELLRDHDQCQWALDKPRLCRPIQKMGDDSTRPTLRSRDHCQD
jgi:hypothetical protein